MNDNIVNGEAARLAYQIAGYMHKPVEEVVRQAINDLAERILPQEKSFGFKSSLDLMSPVYDWREGDDILYDENGLPKTDKPLSERLENVQKFYASLPLLDNRSAEEILGYDENGLPH